MSDESSKFVLVGHDCPLGGYPAIVVPVGKMGGQLVVSYFSPHGPELVPVPKEAGYVEHSVRTMLGLEQFSPDRHGLFAFSEQNLVIYDAGQEREFFASLLRSNESAVLEPFYRFSLAREARLPDVIVRAYDECIRKLRSDCPEFAEEWIRKNPVSVSADDPSLIELPIQRAKTPSLFFQRGQPYPFALLRQQDELGFTEYDIVAPPRRFFSGLDRIPATVEIGFDGRRLRTVATPAELLTVKLREGDNWPAHTRRTVARLFAWFLVCEDPQRRLEAREVETLAHQASLVRHIIDSSTLMRVLIADEVGLGKTVEAGLIVAELLEKQPTLRVLYLSPARLVSNVAKEFARLGLYFRRWTASGDTDANLQDERIIASIHKAAYETNAERVIGAPSWDVLIVDECHHLSSYGLDASKPVRQYSLVQKLIEKRPDGRVLLMSGTPNQGNPDRFNNLLRLLRAPGESDEALEGRVIYRTKEDVLGWQNEPLFPLREVNPPKIIPLIPEYEQWLEEIYHFYVPDDVHSWESSKSAKRRAAGWRCAQALQWAASSVEAGLGYLVRQAIRLKWDLSHPELSAAISAIRPYRLGKPDESVSALFGRIVKEVIRQRQVEDIDDIDDQEDENDWSADQQQLGTLLRQGVQLHARVADSKWEFVWNEILSKATGDQFVLFAQPIETVTALSNFLSRKTGKEPGVIVGGQTDAEREAHIRSFWAGETRFIVSSRAGSEGINLQCAHRLVHVDVPWNPMEMEQRVGRIHRFGSQMTIVVDTVVLERTREERAYAVAYEKLRNIARSLTKGQERFEELFSRVMSLIPPTELQEIMAQAAVGPLSPDDSNRIATLVEAGYKNWRSFHEKFHAEHKLRVPDPGLASWDDLERFIRQHVRGKRVPGFSALRFERRNKRQIESVLDEAPVLELPDGSLVCCADVGGRQILGPLAGPVRPAGLNTPLVATALRNAAFSEESSGVGHVRWSEEAPKPVGIPDGTVGIVAIARIAVRREGGLGWIENKNELHLWVVSKKETPTEILGEPLGETVRGILMASVRTKVDLDLGLASQMSALELGLLDRYRRRTEADVDAGIRYAVFPVCAIVVSD